jgi:hypothetical protein
MESLRSQAQGGSSKKAAPAALAIAAGAAGLALRNRRRKARDNEPIGSIEGESE